MSKKLIDELNGMNGKFDGYVETKDGKLKNFLVNEDCTVDGVTGSFAHWKTTYEECNLEEEYAEFLEEYKENGYEVNDMFLIVVDIWMNDMGNPVELITDETEKTDNEATENSAIVKEYVDYGWDMNEHIAIEKAENGKFYVHYGYSEKNNSGLFTAGAFETLEEAEEALRQHRPKAHEVKEATENPEPEIMVETEETEEFKIDTRDKELLDQMFAYMRDVKGEEAFITWAMENLDMTRAELKKYCDIDVPSELEKLRSSIGESDAGDIAATLIELTGLTELSYEDVEEVYIDLRNAIERLHEEAKDIIMNFDSCRTFWNVLCKLEELKEAGNDTWYAIDGWKS